MKLRSIQWVQLYVFVSLSNGLFFLLVSSSSLCVWVGDDSQTKGAKLLEKARREEHANKNGDFWIDR